MGAGAATSLHGRAGAEERQGARTRGLRLLHQVCRLYGRAAGRGTGVRAATSVHLVHGGTAGVAGQGQAGQHLASRYRVCNSEVLESRGGPTQAAAVPAGDAGGRDHQGHSPSQLSVPPPRWRLAQRGAIPCLQPQDVEQGVCARSEVPSGAATVQGRREVSDLQRGVGQDGRPLAQLQQGRWRDDSEASHTEGHPPCHRCVCTTQPFTRGAGHHPRLRGEAGRRLHPRLEDGQRRGLRCNGHKLPATRPHQEGGGESQLCPGVLQEAEKYLIPCEEGDVVFVPLPIEVFGGWEDEAEREICSLTKALTRQQGQEEGQVKRHTFQRLAVALQRANAGMWTAKDPLPVPSEVSGSP